MKVTCPNCSFTGNIKDELIPDGGRNIGCPKCKEKFFVNKDASTAPNSQQMESEPQKSFEMEPNPNYTGFKSVSSMADSSSSTTHTTQNQEMGSTPPNSEKFFRGDKLGWMEWGCLGCIAIPTAIFFLFVFPPVGIIVVILGIIYIIMSVVKFDKKTCPACRSNVNASAMVCKHCGYKFSG